MKVTQHALKVSRVSRMSKLDTIRKKIKDLINQPFFSAYVCIMGVCQCVPAYLCVLFLGLLLVYWLFFSPPATLLDLLLRFVTGWLH